LDEQPLISFGLPVRNGGSNLQRTLESLQAQDVANIEIIISDNASTDDTQEIMEAAAQTDPRIVYYRSESDQGQIENFNNVFRLARGKYFRWIGCGDRLIENYASSCVAQLDTSPNAIGVTTDYCFIQQDGTKRCAAFHGLRLESPSRLRRLRRFLWLTDCDPLYFDPIYSMVRSDALRKTPLLQIHRDPDHILALELCFAGPFVHVQEYLAERMAPPEDPDSTLAKRYHADLRHHRTRITRRYIALAGVARANAKTLQEMLTSYAYIFLYYIRRVRHPWRRYRKSVVTAFSR